MSSKPFLKETKAIEKAVENMEYLRNFTQEISKIVDDMNPDDSLSVSYDNVKLHTWLKNMLLYMIKHHVIDHNLHDVLIYIIENIESDLDFWKIVAQKTLENRGKLEQILIDRETFACLSAIASHYRILLSLIQIKLNELNTEVTETEELYKQGEKLKELLQRHEEESKRKLAQYVS